MTQFDGEILSSVGGVVREAFEAGAAVSEHAIREVDGYQYAILPNDAGGFRAERLTTEADLENPRRKRGTVKVRDIDSFVEYLNRHKDGATVVFAAEPGGTVQLTGVIDHHDAEFAGWGEHRVLLERPYTRPWIAWRSTNRRALSQVEFAEFIEERMPEIAEPAGALLLEIVSEFRAGRTLQFKSAKNLTNGQVQLQYEEEVSTAAGQNGSLTVPTEFLLSLQPYQDVEPFAVSARLRWRLSGTAVQFTFLLDENVIDDAMERLLDEAIDTVKATAEVPVLRGTP